MPLLQSIAIQHHANPREEGQTRAKTDRRRCSDGSKLHLRASPLATGEALRSGEGEGVGVMRQMQLAFSSLSLMRFCRRLQAPEGSDFHTANNAMQLCLPDQKPAHASLQDMRQLLYNRTDTIARCSWTQNGTHKSAKSVATMPKSSSSYWLWPFCCPRSP